MESKLGWDGAARVLAFQPAVQGLGAGREYDYTYNATGQLTQVAHGGTTYGFSYGDNGLLQQRITPWRTETITQRDGSGRVTAQNVVGAGAPRYSETMTYRGDSRLATYAITGSLVASDERTRTYGYDVRGRLISEPYYQYSSADFSGNLGTGPQTALYAFDQAQPNSGAPATPGREGGLGVRTEQQVSNTTAYDRVGGQNAFQQPTLDTSAWGSGTVPVSLFYDAAGNVAERKETVGATTSYDQTFTWDAWGRLAKISLRHTTASDYDWSATYDGLGRRVQTSNQPINNGAPNGSPTLTTSYYDPEVEFLELGTDATGHARTWKAYGPDRSGRYGGVQGLGGHEGGVGESDGKRFVELNNYFGDAIGIIALTNTGSFSVGNFWAVWRDARCLRRPAGREHLCPNGVAGAYAGLDRLLLHGGALLRADQRPFPLARPARPRGHHEPVRLRGRRPAQRDGSGWAVGVIRNERDRQLGKRKMGGRRGQRECAP